MPGTHLQDHSGFSQRASQADGGKGASKGKNGTDLNSATSAPTATRSELDHAGQCGIKTGDVCGKSVYVETNQESIESGLSLAVLSGVVPSSCDSGQPTSTE